MTPSDGWSLLLVLAIGMEALLVTAWIVERLAHRGGMDVGCPEGCECRGRRVRR